MKRIISAVLALGAAGCFAGFAESPPSDELHVRRGAFVHDVILSGELEAARGEFLNVPPMPSSQTAIKWIAEDGTAVKAGEPVAELDNTALTADLDAKRQSATEALQELQQRNAEWLADLEQKQLDVEKKKAALDQATVDVAIPADLLPARRYEEHQRTYRHAKTEYDKAVDLLRSRRTAVDADRRNLQLRIGKAQREIERAEKAIAELVLRAPRDGIVVVRDHPWEGRKLQVGDTVWMGFPIALLPDLASIRVRAKLADVDDGRIAAGLPAVITLDGYPDMSFGGRVGAVAAVAQESRRMSLRRHFDVLVALDRLDPERMRPGLSARVVVRREAREGVLLVPRAAIDFSSASPRAKLAAGGMRDIKLGACNALECIVVSGLTEGESVAPVVEVHRG